MPNELLTALRGDELDTLLDVPFRFRRRPVPVPANRRLAYRLAVVLLLLRNCCRKNKSSLKRLHFLDWAIRSVRRAESVRNMRRIDLGPTIIRYDPAVDGALRFAAAEKLVVIADGRITLSERGHLFLSALDAENLLQDEKKAMQIISTHVPESWF